MGGANIRAIDFMKTNVISVPPNLSLVQAGKLMSKHRIGGIPVALKNKLIGIITERDIINKVIATGKDPKKVKVKDIMTSPPKVVGEKHEDLTTIARKMVDYDVPRVPIIDNGKLVGIITNKDIAVTAPELINVLVEKLRAFDTEQRSTSAFGRCERCGESGHLTFKNNMFLCEFCLNDILKG